MKEVSRFEGPEQSPGFLLWQVSMQWRRQIEAGLTTIGLTHVQFVLLASVGWFTQHDQKASQAELSRHCKTDINMTSQVLRALEKKGLIERQRHPGNDRSKFPVLTQAGSQLIEKAIPLVESIDDKFFSRSDRKKCLEVFKGLTG